MLEDTITITETGRAALKRANEDSCVYCGDDFMDHADIIRGARTGHGNSFAHDDCYNRFDAYSFAVEAGLPWP